MILYLGIQKIFTSLYLSRKHYILLNVRSEKDSIPILKDISKYNKYTIEFILPYIIYK